MVWAKQEEFENVCYNESKLPIQFDAFAYVKIDYWNFYSTNPKETRFIRHLLTFWPIKQEIEIISSISNETAIDFLEDLLNKISTKTSEFTQNFIHVLNKLNHLEMNPLNMLYYDKITDMLNVIRNPNLIKLFRKRIGRSIFNIAVKVVLRILKRENLEILKASLRI